MLNRPVGFGNAYTYKHTSRGLCGCSACTRTCVLDLFITMKHFKLLRAGVPGPKAFPQQKTLDLIPSSYLVTRARSGGAGMEGI